LAREAATQGCSGGFLVADFTRVLNLGRRSNWQGFADAIDGELA